MQVTEEIVGVWPGDGEDRPTVSRTIARAILGTTIIVLVAIFFTEK